MEWPYYLLKVSACLTLFYCLYLIGLRKLTFFKVNRAYLLLGLAISFVIPTLKFTVEREIQKLPEVSQIASAKQVSYAPVVNFVPETAVSISPEPFFDWNKLFQWSYAAVVIILCIAAFWRIVLLLNHSRKGARKLNGLKLVPKTVGYTNCSFFNYVFIDDENLSAAELEILIRHE